jgi:hypothetical protein
MGEPGPLERGPVWPVLPILLEPAGPRARDRDRRHAHAAILRRVEPELYVGQAETRVVRGALSCSRFMSLSRSALGNE